MNLLDFARRVKRWLVRNFLSPAPITPMLAAAVSAGPSPVSASVPAAPAPQAASPVPPATASQPAAEPVKAAEAPPPLPVPIAHAQQSHPAVERVMVSLEQKPENEKEIITRLIDSFAAIERQQKFAPQPYLPGAGWKKLLELEWQGYRNAIAQKDVETVSHLFRNFFRNEGLSGFWGGENMFQAFCEETHFQVEAGKSQHVGRVDLFLTQYRAWRNEFPTLSLKELDAPRVGNPWGYSIDGVLLYEPVFEYHYQARYFQTLLSHLEKPVVLEIGGGFGGLGYHILKCMPNAKYIGFDLPENCLLQAYYLACAFPKAKVLFFNEDVTVIDRKTIDEYDIIIMPNFMFPKVESSTIDLIANVRSLSEMPVESIAEYLEQIDRIGRLWFFHENIYKARKDTHYGIPSPQFPPLKNHVLVAASETRWPRYQSEMTYPCQENLFLRRDVLLASQQKTF